MSAKRFAKDHFIDVLRGHREPTLREAKATLVGAARRLRWRVFEGELDGEPRQRERQELASMVVLVEFYEKHAELDKPGEAYEP